MTDAVIVAAARSPIGRAGKGSLTAIRPDELSSQIVRSVLAQVPRLPVDDLDDVYWGCADPWGEHGFNIARVVAVLSGLTSTPGATVNRFCASSLQAIRMAHHAIRAGEGRAFIAGGVECVSRYADLASVGWSKPMWHHPAFAVAKERSEHLARHDEPWTDRQTAGGLPDIYLAMGHTAENVASYRGIDRTRQDEYAVRSQHRARSAIESGFFERDITPVTLPDGTVISRDDGPRPDVTMDKVAALPPVFRPHGSVTAASCCPLNDGAAVVVVMAADHAQTLGIRPLARILSTAVSALSPEIMGLGPVESSRRALALAGLGIDDMDLVEMNESFAAQVLPSADDLGIDHDRLNVHGGAIALGHPFGATGARLTTTLIHGLQERDGRYGLVTLCVGGGQGMAMVIERL